MSHILTAVCAVVLPPFIWAAIIAVRETLTETDE